MAEEKKHFDKRTVDRYLEKGLLKETEFQSYLKRLADSSDNAEWIETSVHDTETSEDETSEDETSEDETAEDTKNDDASTPTSPDPNKEDV